MFTKSTYVVREKVGFLKLTDTYDILEADTGRQVAVAQERPGGHILVLRFLINKRLLPTKVMIGVSPEAPPLLSLERGFSLFRSRTSVKTGDGNEVGSFQSKVLSFGGGFRVFDKGGQQIAEVKGDWKGWNFRFLSAAGQELGTVTRKWGGLAKELFTSADNYVINMAAGQPESVMLLLLAAGIAIDTVYKEK